MSARRALARVLASSLSTFSVLLIALAVACGNGADTTLTLRADLSELGADADPDVVVEEAAEVLRARLDIFGAGRADVSVDGERMTVSTDIDIEIARRLLLPRGVLIFQQPATDSAGLVACRNAAGDEFFVTPLQVNPDEGTRSPARCFGRAQVGDPQWEPTATDEEGQNLATLIEPGSWDISNNTALAVQFTDEGSRLLERVTGELTGYPLGVFVDGQLIGAPRIQRTITSGRPLISGFTEVEARIRRAQLNAGPLPLDLSEEPD